MAGLGLLALALVPVWAGGHRGYGLGTTAVIALVLALGYQVTYGLSGQLSVAHAPLAGVGAFTVARLTVSQGWSFWAALPVAVVAAAAAGAVVGLPGIRVRGDVLALVTLGAGEIIQSLYLHTEAFSGGYQGIAGIPPVSVAGSRLGDAGLYGVALGLGLATLWVVWAVKTSPLGRAWLALRDDEVAAGSLGLRPGRLRLLAFSVGAGIAGLAGALYAVQDRFVSSISFGLAQTVLVILAVLLAGEGRLARTVVATVGLAVFLDRLVGYGSVSEGVTGGLILAVVALRLGAAGEVVGWARRTRAPGRARTATTA